MFPVGQRVKTVNGFATPGAAASGVPFVPPNVTAEILGVTLTGYTIVARWWNGDRTISEWTGEVPANEVTTAKNGRPLFPGEAPPAKGSKVGVSGKNNDYSKLRKQGVMPASGTVVTAAPAPVAVPQTDLAAIYQALIAGGALPADFAIPNAPATAGVVVSAVSLSPSQVPFLGTPCHTPNCTGVWSELRGNIQANGNPFVIVKCDKCRAKINRKGEYLHRKSDTPVAVSPLPATFAPVVTSAPAVTLAPSAPIAAPVAPAMPAPAPAVVAAPEPQPAPAVAPAAVFTFPVTSAVKVMGDVRTMGEQENTEMSFSLRKLFTWGTVATYLWRQGVPENEAIAASFRLVALDREVKESKAALANLFQSVFGYKATLPSKHPACSRQGMTRMALTAELNLWIAGPTGCGKTHDVIKALDDLGRTYIRIQGGGDVTRESLLGYMALGLGGVSEFKPGPLTLCWANGWVLVIDEIDKYRDEVISELTAVLEGKGLVLMDDGGRVVMPAPGAAIVATANTVGRGEGLAFTGTKVVNEALRDRFLFVAAEYDTPRDRKLFVAHLAAMGVAAA